MDSTRFDRFTVVVGQKATRRAALGLLAASGLTGLVTRDVTAQQCLANGHRCGRATDPPCCSGRCVHKRGTHKRFCRQAPGQGVCGITVGVCFNGSDPCNANGSSTCLCWVTSRGYSFCGDEVKDCFACETNADCEQRPAVGKAGDRCVQCPTCPDPTANGRACVHPCANPA